MGLNLGAGSEAGVSVAEELFCVREGSLDGFFSPFAECLAPVGQAVCVNALAGVGPDVTGRICSDDSRFGRSWHRGSPDLRGSGRHPVSHRRQKRVWPACPCVLTDAGIRSRREYHAPPAPWQSAHRHSLHPAPPPAHQAQTGLSAGPNGSDRGCCHVHSPPSHRCR